MRIIFSFLILGLVYACAGTSKASDAENQKAKSFTTNSEKGTVYVYRTGRVVGAAGQLMVKVNGMDAGGTGPGTFFKWELQPGTYTFASSTPESSAVVQLDVQAGKSYFLRQDARMGIDKGRVTMKQVDSNKGKKEVAGCKLLVSAYVAE